MKVRFLLRLLGGYSSGSRELAVNQLAKARRRFESCLTCWGKSVTAAHWSPKPKAEVRLLVSPPRILNHPCTHQNFLRWSHINASAITAKLGGKDFLNEPVFCAVFAMG